LLSADEAFGQADGAAIQVMNRAEFPKALGIELNNGVEFKTPTGDSYTPSSLQIPALPVGTSSVYSPKIAPSVLSLSTTSATWLNTKFYTNSRTQVVNWLMPRLNFVA
jgi:hypothetical protein